MSHYYPIFLDLRGKHCLVVGAGEVASGKIPPLLEAGARMSVVAPWLHPRMQALLDHPNLILNQRVFREEDLHEAWLVIAATDQPAVNGQIHRICQERRIWVNVADDTPHCSFILPSIASEGPLKIAISTSGTSPTMAGVLRKKIQTELLTPDLADLATYLGSWRSAINPLLLTFSMKKLFWQRVVQSRIGTLIARRQYRDALGLLQNHLDSVRMGEGLPCVFLEPQVQRQEELPIENQTQERRTA